MKKLSIPKSLVFTVIGIVIFNLLLRWNSFSMPFERDEGEYAYSAWRMGEGEFPYKNDFLLKPPSIIYTYYFSQLLSKDAVWPPRVLATLFALSTTLLLGIIAAKEFGYKTGLVAMWLVTPMLTFPFFMGVTANCEIFMLLPMTGVLGLYVWGRDKPDIKYWFYSGVLSALALSYKPICLYMIAFIHIVWLVKLWNLKHDFIRLIKNISALLVGGIAITFLIMLPVVIKGYLPYFWETAIVYTFYYVETWGFGLETLFRQLRLLLSKWWILVLPITLGNKLFYFGLLLAAFLGVYQSPIGHYYLLIMPSLTIISACGLVQLNKILPKFSLWIATSVVLIMMTIPIGSQFGMTPKELNIWIYGTANPFSEAGEMAKHLSEITLPNDSVFIAGSEPEILFYAKRKSASRFSMTYVLTMDTPKRLDYQKEAVGELEKNPPAAIVVSRREQSGSWTDEGPKDFANYLFSKIDKEYKLVGGYIWTLGGDYWMDNIGKEDIPNASLLLYKRI